MSNSTGKIGYKELNQLVHFNLPLEILDEVDEYVKEEKKDSRVSAVKDLLKVGLWFYKKKHELETIFNNPHLMEEITGQLKEGGLVDFVEHMDASQFQVVWSIFKNEAKARKFKL